MKDFVKGLLKVFLKIVLYLIMYGIGLAVVTALLSNPVGWIVFVVAAFFLIKWLRSKKSDTTSSGTGGTSTAGNIGNTGGTGGIGGTGNTGGIGGMNSGGRPGSGVRQNLSGQTTGQPAGKTCAYCGAQNGPNALYCESCGHKL